MTEIEESFFNWDLVNQSAIDYLNLYKLDTVSDITETERKQAIAIIEEWFRSGEALPKLFKKLRPLFGKERAETIGRTEVTRIFNASKLKDWKSNSCITEKVWTTARDDEVCSICHLLDGKSVAINDNFKLDIEDAGKNETLKNHIMKHGPLAYHMPPAHPNCRCGMRPVVNVEAFGDEINKILNIDE